MRRKQNLGLFAYEKVLHPVRTTHRAAVRAVTPKPARQARRAVATVRHPASSLEGAAKAQLSRAVLGSGSRKRATSRPGNRRSGTGSTASNGVTGALVVLVLGIAFAWWAVSSAYHAVFGPHVKSGPQPSVAGQVRSRSVPHVKAGPQPWVAGHVRSRTGGDYSSLRVSNVRCWWVGDRVQAQMRVANRQRTGATLTVSPQYTLAGHGSHGGSIEGYRDVGVPGRRTRLLFIDAGKPQGVSGQPRIMSCGPDLVGLEGWW
jgi:hypothetical protein